MRTVEPKDATLQNGTQWIGWDAAAKQIRSWNFEADGGFDESTWSKDDGKWTIKTNSTLADGSKVTATNIVTKVDANTITWQSKDQTVNGKSMPEKVTHPTSGTATFEMKGMPRKLTFESQS